MGQDSVNNAVFRGELYWFWDDTHHRGNNRLSRSTGAKSTLPSKGGLDPQQGINLDHHVGREGHVTTFPTNHRIVLDSMRPFRIRSEGREWFYFPCPVPVVGVPATPEAIQDASRYETFTPVREGATWDGKHTDRADGNRWAWKNETPTVDHPRERQLMRNFWFPRRAGIHHLVDFQTGEAIVARDSVRGPRAP